MSRDRRRVSPAGDQDNHDDHVYESNRRRDLSCDLSSSCDNEVSNYSSLTSLPEDPLQAVSLSIFQELRLITSQLPSGEEGVKALADSILKMRNVMTTMLEESNHEKDSLHDQVSRLELTLDDKDIELQREKSVRKELQDRLDSINEGVEEVEGERLRLCDQVQSLESQVRRLEVENRDCNDWIHGLEVKLDVLQKKYQLEVDRHRSLINIMKRERRDSDGQKYSENTNREPISDITFLVPNDKNNNNNKQKGQLVSLDAEVLTGGQEPRQELEPPSQEEDDDDDDDQGLPSLASELHSTPLPFASNKESEPVMIVITADSQADNESSDDTSSILMNPPPEREEEQVLENEIGAVTNITHQQEEKAKKANKFGGYLSGTIAWTLSLLLLPLSLSRLLGMMSSSPETTWARILGLEEWNPTESRFIPM